VGLVEMYGVKFMDYSQQKKKKKKASGKGKEKETIKETVISKNRGKRK